MASKKKSNGKQAAPTEDPKTNALMIPFSEQDRPKHVAEEENLSVPTESGLFFPQIKVLQDLSPELDDEDPKYIEGAKVGQLLVVHGEHNVLVDGSVGVLFVPMSVRKVWSEFVPRKQGGGFVAQYASKEEMEAGFTPGNDIQVCIDYLGVTDAETLKIGEGLMPVVLSFNTPSKLPLARVMSKFVSQFKTVSGVTYRIKGAKTKNRANQRYYNFSIEPEGWTAAHVLEQIEALKQQHEPNFLPEPEEAPDLAPNQQM